MKYKDGYIALITVLIIAAVTVLILVGGLYRSAGVADIRIKEESAERALAAATACAEHALLALGNSLAYPGNEVLSVSEDDCQILPVFGSGNTNRIIYTTSTVLGVTRKLQINIDEVQPSMSILAWREVLSFTTTTPGGGGGPPPPPPSATSWANPFVTSTVNLPGTGNALSAYAVGTTGYIGREANPDDEIYIIDASNPASPTIVGSVDLPGDINDLVVSGNYIYAVTDDDDELLVVNITNPASPTLATSLNLPGTGDGRGVAVKGNRLYVTRNNSGSNPTLHVFDISTPGSPSELGSEDVEGVYDVATSQVGTEYVFIASEDDSDEFTAVNVTNPGSMSVNGSISFSGSDNAYAVAVSGTIAYMGTENRGSPDEFYVIDVSTPNAPSVITSEDYEQVNVLRAGYGFVFAGMDDNGGEFVVFDLSNPATIVEAAVLDLIADVDGLGVSSNRAFAVTGDNAQEVIIIIPGPV